MIVLDEAESETLRRIAQRWGDGVLKAVLRDVGKDLLDEEAVDHFAKKLLDEEAVDHFAKKLSGPYVTLKDILEHGPDTVGALREILGYGSIQARSDRLGKGIEDDLVELLWEDASLSRRVSTSLSAFFDGLHVVAASDAFFVVSLLKIIEHAKLTGCVESVREWLGRTIFALDRVGIAGLNTIATTQPRETPSYVELWQTLLEQGPSPWVPSAYIGLRLQSPAAAIDSIPVLLHRGRGEDPGPLLHGLWNQLEARELLLQRFVTDKDLRHTFQHHVLPRLRSQGSPTASLLEE